MPSPLPIIFMFNVSAHHVRKRASLFPFGPVPSLLPFLFDFRAPTTFGLVACVHQALSDRLRTDLIIEGIKK